jgi:SAM-dependent methyltransferase
MNVDLEYCNPFDGKQENIWMKAEHCGRYLFAADRIDAVGAAKVLDAACADGYGTEMLCADSRDVTGADRNESYLSQGRSRFCNAEFVCLDFDRDAMPFATGELDAVVCFETIEHLEFPERLLGEFARILRPGGLLLLSFPNAAYEKLDEEGNNKDPYHKHIFRKEDVLGLLSESFDTKEVLGQFLCNQAYNSESAAIKAGLLSQEEVSALYKYDPESVRIMARTLGYPCSQHTDDSYSYIYVAYRK